MSHQSCGPRGNDILPIPFESVYEKVWCAGCRRSKAIVTNPTVYFCSTQCMMSNVAKRPVTLSRKEKEWVDAVVFGNPGQEIVLEIPRNTNQPEVPLHNIYPSMSPNKGDKLQGPGQSGSGQLIPNPGFQGEMESQGVINVEPCAPTQVLTDYQQHHVGLTPTGGHPGYNNKGGIPSSPTPALVNQSCDRTQIYNQHALTQSRQPYHSQAWNPPGPYQQGYNEYLPHSYPSNFPVGSNPSGSQIRGSYVLAPTQLPQKEGKCFKTSVQATQNQGSYVLAPTRVAHIDEKCVPGRDGISTLQRFEQFIRESRAIKIRHAMLNNCSTGAEDGNGWKDSEFIPFNISSGYDVS